MTSKIKQVNIGKWWGALKLLGQHVTSYVQYINFALVAVTAYYTSISPYLLSHEIQVPFWLFLGVLVVGILIMFAFEYLVSFPSFFAMWNNQWWNHENPLKEEMEKLNKRLDDIERKL